MELFSCYLCKGITASQMERLAGVAREISVPPGSWLFQEGMEAGDFYVLKEGAVELLTQVDDAFELPLSILRTPGDCFGSSAIISPYTYSVSARSAEDSVVFAVARRSLLRLFQDDPEFGYIVMTNVAQHLLDRLRETRQELKTHFRTLIQSTH
jgi:CRP-like cAMP-binding protein